MILIGIGLRNDIERARTYRGEASQNATQPKIHAMVWENHLCKQNAGGISQRACCVMYDSKIRDEYQGNSTSIVRA